MRRRLGAHGIDRTLLLLLPALAFLGAVFLYPFAYGLVLSFRPERYVGAFANYQQFFADPFLRDTIAITLGVPHGSTSSASGTSTLMWTTSTAATDRAGNPLVAGVVTEAGTADLDF